MAACYASFNQKQVLKKLKKISKKDREKMRDTTTRTYFIPAQPLYQGVRATLEVTWTLGLRSDNQLLQFILEKNEWKIVQ